MSYRPGTETIRFRRPTNNQPAKPVEPVPTVDKFGGKYAPVPAWKKRHAGLLQDLVGRQNNGPFLPSFSLAVRLLLLVRVSAAMYSNIQDCDEIFNFFEPLHYFTYNNGFQTWELSPEYAIRSWTYILLHWPLAHLAPFALKIQKRAAFFVLRISLGILSSIAEAFFYRAVATEINERVGRYVLVMLLGSCGMWVGAGAFLPSTFTMLTTMLGYSYFLPLASSSTWGARNTLLATFFFCLGPLLGWPFAGLLAVPFIVEQVLLRGGDHVMDKDLGRMLAVRSVRLIKYGVACVAGISAPIVLIDSWAYGKLVFPNLNIVLYNIFSSGPTTGPEIFGTEPFTFYFANLFLNFNFLFPLALLSLPALAITYLFDHKRLGTTQQRVKADESSPYTLLLTRLSGFYLWLGVLSLQAHKEERFMYPLYPLLCMNAGVTIFLIKGWAETVYVKVTASPYNAGRSKIFSYLTLSILAPTVIISASRTYALGLFYHAPMDVAYHFQYTEIPNILIEAGYKPIPPPPGYEKKQMEQGYNPEWDFTVLKDFDPTIKLCYGKEWFRYPGSYLIPEGIEVDWIKGEFDGMMPMRWQKSLPSKSMWKREQTRTIIEGRFNNQNEENMNAYVNASECTYIIDSSMPSADPTVLQPDYAADVENWDRLFCTPFLDASLTPWWARVIYLPGKKAEEARVWGEYCLLRNRNA